MPNWKKVIVSGSDAALNSLDVAGGITGSDVTIDDWGSISASLASINATGSTQNLQQVTDNGNTTTNGVNILGTVGIGTDNPTYQLHVSSSTAALGVYERAGGAALYLEGQLDKGVMGTVGTHPLLIAYNSGEVARFTGNSFLVTGSLDVSTSITGSDVTIDDWGSVSASLSSISTTSSAQTLDQVTDNGNTTTNGVVFGEVTVTSTGSQGNVRIGTPTYANILTLTALSSSFPVAGVTGTEALSLTSTGGNGTIPPQITLNIHDRYTAGTAEILTVKAGQAPYSASNATVYITRDGHRPTTDKMLLVSGSAEFVGGDIEIADWGSISASLASIESGASSSNQNLQQVTDQGNTTTNDIFVGSSVRVGNGTGSISTNTVVGSASFENNTSGYANTAIGGRSLEENTTGYNNTAVGYLALNGVETGYSNVAIGRFAMTNAAANANSNTAVGDQAFDSGLGNGNTVIGQSAFSGAQLASYNNVMVGESAGSYDRDSNQNYQNNNSIFIGAGASSYTQSAVSNEIVIGYNAIGKGANTVVIGNSNITNNYFSGDVSSSDAYIDDWGSVSASLADIAGGSAVGTLQQVTDNGSTTTNEISTPNILINSSSANHIVKYGYQAASNASENTNGGVVIGQLALSSSANSVSNTVVIGPQAMYNYTGPTTGNTVIGAQSALYLISGVDNTILGQGAVGGTQATASSYNTAIGGGSLAIVQGNYNTALGYGAGAQQSQGSGSIYIGKSAGIKNDGGSHGQHDSIYIGTSASPFNSITPGGTANEIVIGAYQTGSGANTFNIQGKLRGNANGDITASGDFYTLGAITGSDVKINGWGSVSASLASINTSLNPTLQQVTLNGSNTNQTITISSSVNLGLTALGPGGIDLWAPSSATSRVTMKAQSGSAVITEGEIYHQQDNLIPQNVWRAKNYNGGYENIIVQGDGDLDLFVPTSSYDNDYTQFSVRFYTSSLGDPREQFEIRHYPSDDSITASLQGMFTSSDAYIDDWGSISASLGSISSTLGPGTISGRALGSNLENLNADGVTLTFDVTSSAYNGSTELTLSAITGSVASGSTALATGDQIVSYVNSITTGLDLQGVTDVGATTSNAITASSFVVSSSTDSANVVLDVIKDTLSNGASNTVLTSWASTYAESVTIDYVTFDSGKNNKRAGTIRATWNSSTVVFDETSTSDIGNTSALTLDLNNSTGTIQLRGSNSTGQSMTVIANLRFLQLG